MKKPAVIERVERWLDDQRLDTPSAADLAEYIRWRAEFDFPGNPDRDPPTPAGLPPFHDWMRQASLALAKTKL